jgi:glycosyltransferase involved in cell wall biosynthesis
MESLACGVPTILSANTGHLDLIGAAHCYPLRSQGQVAGNAHYRGTEGWGEAAVEEVVAVLEEIYADRAMANQRGAAAAEWMQNWTWARQTQRFLKVLAELQ